MAEPTISVILPVYNAGRYLRLAVLSIVNQSFVDWELLIVDDASTDDAVERIADIVDSRIRLIRNPKNVGLAATLNVGIDLARGEFIARMDQDDVSYPRRLERQIELLRANPELDLVAVRCLAIDANNDAIGALPFAVTHEALCIRPWRGFYLPHPTWMGRSAWFRRHRYASPGPYLSEDQELLLRSYRSSRFETIPEMLFAYRVRNRIDWSSAFKTRKTVVRGQMRYFLAMREWRYGLLAMATFLYRVAVDALNVLTQGAGYKGNWGYPLMSISQHEKDRWRETWRKATCAGR